MRREAKYDGFTRLGICVSLLIMAWTIVGLALVGAIHLAKKWGWIVG